MFDDHVAGQILRFFGSIRSRWSKGGGGGGGSGFCWLLARLLLVVVVAGGGWSSMAADKVHLRKVLERIGLRWSRPKEEP